jgi:large subunit ribosomal protein L25
MATKMQDLQAELRQEIGTRRVKVVRRGGYVPAVLYSKNRKTASLKIKYKDLEKVLSTEAGINVIINLKITGGKKTEEQPAITCDLDKDVLTDQIIHIDFHGLELKEKLQTGVPVTFVGEAPGVKLGGILVTVLRDIRVECLPLDIPSHFELDISNLSLHKSLHISDIKVEEKKIKILNSAEEVVVSCIPPKEEVEEVVAPEGVQPEVIGKEKEEGEEEVVAEGKAEPAAKEKPEKPEKPEKSEKATKETPKTETK